MIQRLDQLSKHKLDQLAKVIDPIEIKRYPNLAWSRLALSFNKGLTLELMVWTLKQRNFRHGWSRVGLAEIGVLTRWDETGHGRYTVPGPGDSDRVRNITFRGRSESVSLGGAQTFRTLEQALPFLDGDHGRGNATAITDPQVIIDHPNLNWDWNNVVHHRWSTPELFDLWLDRRAPVQETQPNRPLREDQRRPFDRDEIIAQRGFARHLRIRDKWPAHLLVYNHHLSPRTILDYADNLTDIVEQPWLWIWSSGTPHDYADYPQCPWRRHRIFAKTTMTNLYRHPPQRRLCWRCLVHVPGIRLADLEKFGLLAPMLPVLPQAFHDLTVLTILTVLTVQ